VTRLIERKDLEEIKPTIDEKLKTLTKDMDERLTDFRDRMTVLQKRTSETVNEHPLLILGVAFVLGMALGLALSRSTDKAHGERC
jgi:ElaB/YqjD/DUF883 family membrane-anchored ribosome-binding protein